MSKLIHAAVFGGTYDPIQQGHVAAIRYLLEMWGMVIVAPTSQNPWKERKATSLEHRVEMIHRVLRHEQIPIIEDPDRYGVYISPVPYERSREFIDFWRSIHGIHFHLIWAVGPDIAAEVQGWSDGWLMQNVPTTLVPETIKVHATDIREGRAEPHPAIISYVHEHRLYGRKLVAP